jgi:hypothetical protein
MDDHAEYGLILPFDSDEPEFVRGFEAGRLYEQLHGDEPFSQTIHASNAEMAMRMCEAVGRDFSADQVDHNWIELHAGEKHEH